MPGNAAIRVESVSRGEDAVPCLLHEVICRVAVSGQAPATLKQLRPVTMDQPIEGHHIHGVRADRFDQLGVQGVFASGIGHGQLLGVRVKERKQTTERWRITSWYVRRRYVLRRYDAVAYRLQSRPTTSKNAASLNGLVRCGTAPAVLTSSRVRASSRAVMSNVGTDLPDLTSSCTNATPLTPARSPSPTTPTKSPP